MSNPYAQYVVPQAEGQPEGNPYAQYIAAPVVDEAGQDIISRTNNPNVETPESFGFTEIAPNVAKGFASDILSFPQTVGGSLVQQGELIEGKDANDIATSGLADILKEGDLLSSFGRILKLEKDLLVNGVTSPQELRDAGTSMVTNNQAVLEKAGLVRPEDGLGKYGFDVGQGLSSVGKSVALTVITKKPSYAAALQGWTVNSADYREARTAGKTPDEASYIALTSAAGQSMLESFGGKYFLNAAVTSPFIKKVVVRAAGQGAEEGTQASWEAAVKNKTGVRNQTWTDALSDIGYQAALGFIVGAPVSAVAGTFEKSAIDAGIPAKDAKKMAAAFVKSKDEIVSATAQLMHNEASGVAVDKGQVEAALAAIKPEVVVSEIQQPEIDYKPYMAEADKIKKSLNLADYNRNDPATLRGRIGYTPESIVQFIKRNGKIVDQNGELAARDITPQKVRGLFKKAAEQSESMFADGTPRPAMDELRQRLFDAGYFNERENYDQITDDDIFDAIAEDVNGNRIYTTEDDTKIAAILDNNVAQYDAVGINKESSVEDIARVLASQSAKPAERSVSPDANDPRFNGELDIAKSTGKFSDEATSPDAERKAFYQRALEEAGKRKKSTKMKDYRESASKALNAALTPISTRLRAISPKFEARLRKFEFDKAKQINADSAAVTPFLSRFEVLSPEDKVVLDLALKNGDTETINSIAKANGMEAQLGLVRDALDGLYKRASDVGLEIGYRENYFPRTVKDPKKLIAHFQGTEAWNVIEEAIRQKQLETGTILNEEEKAHLINTLLRGYKVSQITLSKPSALKERNIDQVTPEIMGFYEDSTQAILRYITTVNEAIEARKLFGKPAENIADSIGAFVLDELAQGNITPNQAQELSEIMKARFIQGKMNPVLRAYKNLSYIDTMGSPISAITQLSGLSYSLSNNGFYNTFKALTTKKQVSVDDINVTRIAQEFEDSGTSAKALKFVFDAVGLSKLDALDKNVFINSTLRRYQKLAKNPSDKLYASLEHIFGAQTDEVVNDLQTGVVSENVKLLLFNELADMQPITLSEMPEMYLKHPNGRIFYMLKTFTLKQYDVYRKQVFQEIAAGNAVTGLKNLTRLVSFMVFMGAGADFLKDLVLGRETPPEDAVVNNIARVFGFSKYQVYSVRREGLGAAAFKTIAPPFKFIDSTSKDFLKAIDDGELDINNLETVNSVPIVGKFYYWWFGAGSED